MKSLVQEHSKKMKITQLSMLEGMQIVRTTRGMETEVQNLNKLTTTHYILNIKNLVMVITLQTQKLQIPAITLTRHCSQRLLALLT